MSKINIGFLGAGNVVGGNIKDSTLSVGSHEAGQQMHQLLEQLSNELTKVQSLLSGKEAERLSHSLEELRQELISQKPRPSKLRSLSRTFVDQVTGIARDAKPLVDLATKFAELVAKIPS